MKINVRKNVFDPNKTKTNSTSIILNNLPDVSGREVLDMGCGSGIIGIYCALHGAKKVVSADINDEALENTKENVETNNVSDIVEVLKSDLFENVNGKFDYIFANLPISDKSWKLSTSTLDLVKKFISQSRFHVNENGKTYLVWGSMSPVLPVRKYLKENNLMFKEIKEKKLNRTWYLFQIEHG